MPSTLSAVDGLTDERMTDLLERDALPLLDLMTSARRAVSGAASRCFTCGIVNIKSGQCQENCRFCAQSAHHRAAAPAYPMLSSDMVLARAEALAQSGMDYCGLVMSGAAPIPAEFDRLCDLAERAASRVAIAIRL